MFGFFETYWDPLKDVPDMKGKVALVTGGNGGIGYTICSILAANNCKVYLGARSEQRAKEAITEIEKEHPSVKEKKNVFWLKLDLTEPKDVIASAKDFMSKEERLDILINNAARLPENAVLCRYGVDLSIAINHIGQFVLVDTLLPVLKATSTLTGSSVRICVISADLTTLHQIVPPIQSLASIEELSTPWPSFSASDDFFSRLKRYGYTKLLNEYFKGELQRRLSASEHDNIIVMSTDPGMVKTAGSIATYPLLFKAVANIMGTAPAAGAASALFGATAGEVSQQREKYKGSYLGPKALLAPTSKESQDVRLGAELWVTTQAIVEKALAAE